ncbi:MAG: glycoside hydrolase family 16 protein [Mucinivorans sp.]
MKKFTITLLLSLFAACSLAQNVEKKEYRMIWNDEFDGTKIDQSKWSRIPRGQAHWNVNMSEREDLVQLCNGNVLMHGVMNPDRTIDTARYLTGGLYSKGKFSFLYGKVEIRAQLGSIQGAWPAFWMLPEKGVWPKAGEMDIMEHLNFDDFVYQTTHSYYTHVLKKKDHPKNFSTGKITNGEYNIYAVEWTPTELIYSVNGVQTYVYPKIDTKEEGQWPFTTPFYILIDQQLGGPGTWVGPVNEAQLPVTMWIDYVRVYQK